MNQLKTSSYLWRRNILSSWIILNSLALFNWDIIIAKYNVYYHNNTNMEIFYLSGLSEKTLFVLDSEEFEKRYQTDSKVEHNYIANKKEKFINKWKKSHWLSWNLADYNCYNKLINK